jgi:MFS family permease
MWVADTVSLFGSSLSSFALPLVAIITLGATTEQMGIMQAVQGLPVLFLGLLAGVWVDRANVRRLLIRLDLLAAAVIVVVPVTYALGVLSLPVLYAVQLGFGFLSPFWWPAYNRFLPQVVGTASLVDANSKVNLAVSATHAIGPTLAGALVQVLKAPVLVVADSVSFLVSAVLYRRIEVRNQPAPREQEPGSVVVDIRAGLRTVFSDRLQRSLTIPRAVLDVVDAMAGAIYVIFAIRFVGLSPGALGLVFSLSSVGFLVGSVLTPRMERNLGAGHLSVLGLLLVGVSPYTMLLADAGHPSWLNVLFLVIPGLVGGFGGMLQFIGMNAIRQSVTPEGILGRVFATTQTLRALLTIVGALVGGLLGGAIGLRPTIGVCCVGYGLPFCYSLVAPFRSMTIKSETEPEESPPIPDPLTPPAPISLPGEPPTP